MKTTEKIQRITERGQITLPIAWRRKMGNTSTIIVRTKGDTLEISPLRTEDERDEEWVTLFDAVRDNKGRGIPATEFAKLIRRVNRKS
jgi:bifunctional DNA-binding transcriptional regulator/antitoxin component of YhaV-PrlF toxin-antitoxin module